MKLRQIIAVCTLLVVSVWTTGCEEFEGVIAPHDRLHFPVGVALHPEGRYLYVVNSNFDVAYQHDRGGTITVVDTDMLEILSDTTVTIGSFGGDAVLSEDASRLYAAVRGDNSVVRLDVSPDGGEIDCGGELDGLDCRIRNLASDPSAILVETFDADLEIGGPTPIELIVTAHLQSDVITAISIKDGDATTAVRKTVELIPGGSAIAISPRTGYYYVVGRFTTQARSFLPVVGSEGDIAAIYGLSSISLANPRGNYDARDIVFSSDGNRAFVAARNPDSILVLDTSAANRETGGGSRDIVIDQIDLEDAPTSLAYVEEETGPFLYVLEFGGDRMTVVEPDSHRVVDHIDLGDGPSRMVVDQTRYQRIYVSLFNEAAVAVVDIDPQSPRYRTAVAKIR